MSQDTDRARAGVAAEISRQTSQLAEAVTDRQYALEPEWEKYGARGRELSVRDVAYHLPFLVSAIAADEPRIYATYVAWVRTLFVGLGFPEKAAHTNFACIRDVLAERLPPEMAALATPYAAAGVAEFERPIQTLAGHLEDDGQPLRPLARTYLDALLRGDRKIASSLVLESVERGADLRDVYLHVLQDAQHEVGRLWMTHRISVAKEHFCTAVTQSVIAQLYPRIMSTRQIGKKILVVCASGERHEVGARMLADLFELSGWDAVYLGGDTPASACADAVREHRPDVLGISANMAFNLRGVQTMIAEARKADPTGKLTVLVGGYQFNHLDGLWKKAGADGWAPDGSMAVELAAQLVAAR